MEENVLERVYQENLEERIIIRLSETNDLSYEQAMDIYYKSRLADMIQSGQDGIQYLDYKVLVEILLDTEKELFDAVITWE